MSFKLLSQEKCPVFRTSNKNKVALTENFHSSTPTETVHPSHPSSLISLEALLEMHQHFSAPIEETILRNRISNAVPHQTLPTDL